MESEWELDRIRLFQLRRAHPDWTLPRLAHALHRSLSWVKKWLKRFQEAGQPSLAMFKSRSRAPHHRPKRVVAAVRDAILSLRDGLNEVYGRVVGAKTILYHLHRDRLLQERQLYLPRSTRTIWHVLKDGERIPIRVREPHPLQRPDPMRHWEMDFGQLGNDLEFLTVVDRGTSILVSVQTQAHYRAETALLAVARVLGAAGRPQKLRFDNDTRFVGNWLTDGFPSPLMRFLLCLGVEPDVVEPGKPYHKPFAERSVRTLKYECLRSHRPDGEHEIAETLERYQQFYNQARANQSLACGNRPPYEAFPQRPTLPAIPEQIDPDGWLQHYHGRLFKRRVGQNGQISVGNHSYYVGCAHAGKPVGVVLDAQQRMFTVVHRGTVVRQLEIQGLCGCVMPFEDYFERMRAEARTLVA